MSFGSKPGGGAIIVLIIGVILLLSGNDDEDEDGERKRGGNRGATPTQPRPAGEDRARGGHARGRGDARGRGAARGRDRAPGRDRGPDGTRALVTRVIDGDTVEVALPRGEEDVRYIGIDTPESVAPGQPVECFGKRASAFNERLVEGERVELVFDDERRDYYGRLLAYVYAGELFVNAELVREGFARTLSISPNTRHAGRFGRLERRAGHAGRGLWGACGP